MYRGNRRTAPLILRLGTRCRSVVNITPRPLYSRVRTTVPTENAAGWAPESIYTISGEEKISSPGRGMNPSNIFLYSDYGRSRNPQSASTSYADPNGSLKTSVKPPYKVTATSQFKPKETGQLHRSKFKPYVEQDATNNCIGSTESGLQFLPFDCVRSI